MRRPVKPSSLNAFVDVRCLCGQMHTFIREKVVDGLGLSRWKCGGCKRRFVIACVPGSEGHAETFWPVFLDQVPSTGSTVQDGTSMDGSSNPPVVEEIKIRCRCGCRLVARSQVIDKPVHCPRCESTFIVRLGYKPDTGDPLPLLEYRDARNENA
jgi:hypothetical protein